jgi:hypothetical protein
VPIDDLLRAWAGGKPWSAEIEVWTARREVALVELTELLIAYLSGDVPLKTFSTSLDSFSKRTNLWGFRGHAGQMFLNLLMRTASSAQLNKALRAALQAPFNEPDAESKISQFVHFVEKTQASARTAGAYPPKAGYAPYFLSFFWEAQDRTWPIYYPRSRSALVRAGLFREAGPLSQRYVTYRREILSLTEQLGTDPWGVEVFLFELERQHQGKHAATIVTEIQDHIEAERPEAFEESVATVLAESGLHVERRPSFGGAQPDFVVIDPTGRTIVVETRTFAPIGTNRHRASEQSRLYREALGADAAFIVLQGLESSEPATGLVRLSDLLSLITSTLARVPEITRREHSVRSVDRLIFAAMPFQPAFEDVYFLGMAPASEDNGATCVRIDHEHFVGDVVAEIKTKIRASHAVIGDLSLARANVLYEMGFAAGIGKPIIQISSSPLHELPFDVRNDNTLRYTLGQVHVLRNDLSARLAAVLP